MAEVEGLEGQRLEAQGKLEAALVAIEEQQGRLDDAREQAAHLGKQIATVGEQLGAAREHRSGLVSRQKLLKDLEARREGVSEGVKSVLRKREPGQPFAFVRGLVADVLRVDVEHAHVIEAALDGRDQWLVTDDSSAVAAAVEAFEDLEGRVNVLCTDVMDDDEAGERDTGVPPVPTTPSDQTPPDFQRTQHGRDARVTNTPRHDYDWNQHPQRIRFAVDLVRFEPADALLAHHLLGNTIVVSDLNDAMELYNAGPEGFRYVTHNGEVLEADGTLRAGPLTAAMGLLSRRSELEALNQQIGEVDARIAQLTAQLAEGNTAARALQEEEAVLRNDIYRSNTAKVELTSQIAQNQDKQGSLRREQPVLDRELEGLLEQVGKLKSEEDDLAEQRQHVEAEQSRQQFLADEAAAEQGRLAEELRHNGEQLTAARVQLGQVQEKQLASQQHVQRLTAAKAELGQQAERLARSAEAVAGKRGGVEEELEDARSAEAGLVEKQRALGEQIETVTANAKAAGEAVQSMGREVESLRARHAEVEQELHGLDLKLNEVKVRLETLVQRTMEELQLDLPAQYESLSADGGAGYQPAETDWDAVAEEIKTLRDKIHRLGNVNLDAIGEQDELEQRSTFMANQLNDLRESKRQLEELIDTINTESSVRFEQTFNAVREHFQGMFRKLFGGGKADVFLETEVEEKAPRGAKPQAAGEQGQLPLEEVVVKRKVDVLDAGIEIIARPPGKQPVSISQLSGGEKTMTCVALLMSIFKSKPSPFCILDEVDAALDEANNQRFNGIVQEFLEQSQFIVITHSKRTMQIADVLYGVTMQEQGVSKKVAVKFDQVDSQGRITEQAAA
jgi:chromosome segregation protein